MSASEVHAKEQQEVIRKLENKVKSLELERDKSTELAEQVENLNSKLEKQDHSHQDLLKKVTNYLTYQC